MTLHCGEKEYVLIYKANCITQVSSEASSWKYGHSFLGHSDTEVLLHAYARWERTAF
jgi:asparagine synthetase B (glutamine-hydrolysing)